MLNFPAAESGVIAAGPITKTRASIASRIVLVQIPEKSEYVVWRESFPNYPDLSQPSFSNGNYFPFGERNGKDEIEQFQDATSRFGQRVAEDAVQHYGAIEEDRVLVAGDLI